MSNCACVLLALVLSSLPARAEEPVLKLRAADLEARPTFCAVPEMAFVPEADGWDEPPADALPERDRAFAAAWGKQSEWAAGHVTPALARALSRWAKPQMEKYAAVPPLDKLTFKPVAAHKGKGMVVYEATADTLPVHNPLVTRWLRVYVLYAVETKAILRITVTIRGQVTE